MNNKKLILIFVMLSAIIIGMLCCGKEVQAASSGTIPCSSGSVAWTLDDEGVLTFSGNGTTKLGKYVEYGDGSLCWVEDWNVYWSEVAGVDVTAVTSVMVAENSVIQLDTCKNMFRDFSSVTSVNLVGINTDKVTNMWGAFQNCSSLKELDVSSFNTENVSDMHAMFYNCSSLTELEISNFNTEKVIDMLVMFNGCSSLEELDVSNFKTEDVTSMNGMFYGCSSLEELDVSNFKTENIKDMGFMFSGCSSLEELDVSNFNTENVTSMNGMFNGCSSLEELDVSYFNTENITSMSGMFSGCSSLEELDVSNFNTENVTSMSGMFRDCSSLKELDVSNFYTENITSMSGMFSGCSSLEELDVSNFNTENVTSMSGMFRDCSSLEELDVSGLNAEKVTDMYFMFGGCSSLKELDISGFKTKSVNSMGYMFDGCSSLMELKLSNFNTEEVTDMGFMFNGCSLLKELDVSSFNTENVTNMGWMFSGCRSLEKLDLSTFRTGNVTYMERMFNNCGHLTELNVSNFDTKNVTDMGNMFDSCFSLKELDVSSFNTENVVHMGCMFLACRSLKELDLSKFDVRRVSSMIGLIGSCDSLTRFVTPTFLFTVELPASPIGKVWKDSNDNSYKDTQYYTFERSTELNLVDEIYTISYVDTDKATNTEDLIEEYTYGSEYTLPALKGQCLTFKGWFLDKEYTKECLSITDTTTGNLTLYAKWEDAHDIVRKNDVVATCHSTGYSGDEYCQACEKQLSTGHVIETVSHDYDMENGTVLTEATTTTTGTIQYKCKNCTATITGTIPRLQGVEESTILDKKSEDDIKGSSFSLLQARADKVTRKSIRLKWTKVEHADGYIIYGNKCGRKYSYKKIKTIDKNNTTTYTHKKLNGKNLKKGTYYKYIVIAYKNIEGQKISIAVSKTVHAATNGGKYGSAKSITIKTDNKLKKKNKQYILTLKKNKKYTIKASEVNQSKKIKRHRKIAYESTDSKVVTVSKKGVIKGKNKGICYVYVYAQNGVYKKIKVIVN